MNLDLNTELNGRINKMKHAVWKKNEPTDKRSAAHQAEQNWSLRSKFNFALLFSADVIFPLTSALLWEAETCFMTWHSGLVSEWFAQTVCLSRLEGVRSAITLMSGTRDVEAQRRALLILTQTGGRTVSVTGLVWSAWESKKLHLAPTCWMLSKHPALSFTVQATCKSSPRIPFI